MDEVGERLGAIGEALDAAEAALARARARNVPRSRLPGPLGGLLLAAYNRLFVVQREIAADQNDALVAVVNALREVVRVQTVQRPRNDPPRA